MKGFLYVEFLLFHFFHSSDDFFIFFSLTGGGSFSSKTTISPLDQGRVDFFFFDVATFGSKVFFSLLRLVKEFVGFFLFCFGLFCFIFLLP